MFKRIMFLGVVISLFLSLAVKVMAADPVTIWFPPEWKAKADMAKQIADALSKESNLQVNPRIATSYPDIIEAFGKSDMTVLYGGSFLTAILKARNLGNSLVQNIDGKELYSGIMVYPKGDNPEAVLKDSPTEIAFALGASSGESSAKAATGGKAAIPTPAHGASCGAIKAGKAKAAFVKNWWWEANKQNYPELDVFVIPGISEINLNP